jgi:hypothetical protein
VGKDRNGRDLYVAALVGGQVSNDHLPYYEIVAVPAGGERVTIKSLHFYWWDLAGLEGFAHWLGGIAGTVLVSTIWFLVVAYKTCRRFILARRRGMVS